MPHTAERPLIGLTGKAGAGKDTAGLAILGWFGYLIGLEKFADPLKRMIAILLSVPVAKMEDREWRATPIPELGGKTPLDLMLSLGTEWGREMVHPDVWVFCQERKWQKNVSGALLTDVRFDNEAEWILNKGGVIIELVRIDDDHVDPRSHHKSEDGIKPRYISRTVGARKGDIEGLQRRTLKALRELGCQPS